MFIKDSKRFNIYASATIDNIQYGSFVDPAVRAAVGITEISEPAPPQDYTEETYTREDIDDAPYVVYTPMTEEAIQALHTRSATAVWERIKEERERRIMTNGVKVVIDGNDYWFHTDVTSLIQQLGLNVKAITMLLAATPMDTVIPGITPWKTMSGVFVQLKLQDALAILAAGAAMQGAIFQAAEIHKAAMEATPAPLKYNYLSSGWPESYEESLPEPEAP